MVPSMPCVLSRHAAAARAKITTNHERRLTWDLSGLCLQLYPKMFIPSTMTKRKSELPTTAGFLSDADHADEENFEELEAGDRQG